MADKLISFFMTLAAIATFFSSHVAAAAFIGQKCRSDVHSMPDVDLQKLSGLWFGDSTNENSEALSCATIVYPRNISGSSFFVVKKFLKFDGSKEPVDMSTAAAYDEQHQTLLEHYAAPSVEVLLTTKILATDYDTYAIIYSCGISANFENEGITVLSRSPTGLPLQVRRALHDMIETKLGAKQYVVGRHGCKALLTSGGGGGGGIGINMDEVQNLIPLML